MDKVIHDIKFTETGDGFCIEIKGNKETIRQMWQNFGSVCPCGNNLQFDIDPDFWSSFNKWCCSWLEAAETKQEA